MTQAKKCKYRRRRFKRKKYRIRKKKKNSLLIGSRGKAFPDLRRTYKPFFVTDGGPKIS
jgi:hypothetical protein